MATFTKTSQQPISEQPAATTDVAYSVFSVPQRKAIVLAASLTATFSPMSTTIYLPAIDQVAKDLHVSSLLINLTVTTFLVSSCGLNCVLHQPLPFCF